MKSRLGVTAINLFVRALMWACLWAAVSLPSDGAGRVVAFYIGFMAVVAFLGLLTGAIFKPPTSPKDYTPAWLKTIDKFAFAAALVWIGWLWVAAAYVFAALTFALHESERKEVVA
jgi:nitrate/nitrite transporter NarK